MSGRTRPMWVALAGTPAMLAAFVLALQTQLSVGRAARGEVVVIGLAVAVALFLGGLMLTRRSGLLEWPDQLQRLPDFQQRPAFARVRVQLALGALALGAATFVFSGGNRFTALNIACWIGSVGLAMAAFWQGTVQPQEWLERLIRRPGDRLHVALSWHAVALTLVFVAGAFFLFYRIADVPREMTSDHAEKLYDVRDLIDGQHLIFFPRNTGREAFQFYLIALMAPLTGVTYLTMKLGTALLAFGALPFTYLLARTVAGPQVALMTTAVLASTRWLWQVGRVGLRFPFPPLFGAAIFFFLLKALRDRRRNDFLLCGLALGVAQHTYTALRLAPLGVFACIGIAAADDYFRRNDRERLRALITNSSLLGAIAALVFMPLARYATDQPQMFLFRGVTRIASDTAGAPPPNLLGAFAGNVKNALLMFNWRGDTVWVNTIPNEPFLDPVSGALFVLGCAYGIYRLIRFRELPYLYLIILLFVGLLPSILTLAFPQENPSTVRTGMAIPVTALLVALPLTLIARRLKAWIGGAAGTYISAAFVAGSLVGIAGVNADQYFRVYPFQHARASQHTSYVGAAVRGFMQLGGRREDAYVLPGAHWIDWRLVAIEAGDVRWSPLVNGFEDARRHDGVARPRLYVVQPSDQTALDAFRRWYPVAIQTVHRLEDAGGNPWFVTVFVPAGATAQTGA